MNRQFPALRGLAILLVVLNHSITLGLLALRKYGYPPAPVVERYLLVTVKQLGLIAVPTFLFLSGCFIVYAVQGKGWRAAYKSVGAGLKHIVWPYLIWSLVYYALVYFLEGETYSLAGYAKNLVVGYPFNFVPLLLAYYAVAPVLARLGQRFPWLTLLVIGGYQLFVINVLKPGTLGFAFPDWAYALTPPALRVSVAVWGIFFPLGMVYSLHAARWLPVLQRLWPVLALAAVVLFALAALQELSLVNAPLADILCPVGVILLYPLVRRDQLPFISTLEQFGKRAYGLYLTNLIVLNLVLALIHALAPWAFGQLLLLTVVLFMLTLTLPRLLMTAAERLPYPKAHRYVFG